MQKKILAAAVAGALASPLAFAQSSVTIYGAFDHSIHNYRVSGGGASFRKWDVYNQSSRIGFRGEESLGGGMRAWFQAENGLLSDGRQNNPASGAWANRNTGVGLTGGWGTIMAGHWDSPYRIAHIAAAGVAAVGGFPGHNGPTIGGGSDTTGTAPNQNCDNLTQAGNTVTGVGSAAPTTAVCGQAEGNATSFHRRLSNTVQYWLPTFGGFTGRIAFEANENKSVSGAFNNNPSLWAATGTYAAGPLNVTVGYEQHRGFRDTNTTTSTRNTKDKGWLITGGYNFGFVNLQATYERLDYGNANSGTGGSDTSFKRPAWYLGAAFPLGPAGSALRTGYSRAQLKSCGAGIATCGDATKVTIFTLGYEYAFSKRTAAYVEYGRLSNSAASTVVFNTSPTGPNGVNTTIPAGADQSSLGVGVKHTF